MAPANQGSRNGLIAAVVVFVILFVIAAIFAIYYNAELRKQEKALTNTQQQYEDISDLTGPEIESLKRARTEPANNFNRNMKLLDVAAAQRDKLKKIITGNDQQTTAAAIAKVNAAADAAAAQAKQAGVVVSGAGDNLIGTINTLAAAVVAKNSAAKQLQQELAAANEKVKQAEADKQKALGDMQKAIAQAQQTAQKEIAAAVSGRTSLQETLKTIEAAQAKQRQTAVEAVNKKDQQVAAKNRQVAQLQKDLDSIRAKLQSMRINTDEPILRQADGQIARVASEGIVFIDRGQGDQITSGLTFEVYDKATGIPPVTGTQNADSLPIGKASIEVIHVGAATSECRVVRQSPGQTIDQGDIIVNLVYDPHTKYNFVVYGKFDLDHNSVPTAQDAEVVKRLITQWGARVVDKVNADTDFVVLGAEPELPVFTAADLKDPINRKKLDDAQAALNAYQAVKQSAVDLHIPVLNQNRFLYLIGYYDQAAK
jgi:hypothetical protein